MTPQSPIQKFYQDNPRMVSSPFGGVDGIDGDLLLGILRGLDISLSGKRVLDVGCGRGFAAELVHAADGTYTGLDLVDSGARRRFVLGSATELPFPEAAFDLVCCIDAFEHIPDPVTALCEFHRVLRPGGSFFLSAPNYGNVAGLVKFACEKAGCYAPNTWAPFGRWQPQEWETPLTQAKLRRWSREAGLVPAKRLGFGREVGLGLFPWMAHPRLPERVYYRLQRLFNWLGPSIARVAPGASLHLFWRFDKPVGG